MIGHYRWPDLEISAEAFRAQALALPSPRLVDLIDLPYREHLRRAGKPRFGDKTPPYVAIVPELLALYPDARFINLIRDGRDVAISFVDAHFHGRPYHADFEWTQALRFAERWRASTHADRILDVRYEDLVRDPETVLRRICDFLGETFELEMIAAHRDRLTLIPDRERWIQEKLARPINADAIAAWRKRVTAFECFCIEASLHEDLRRYGYTPRFAAPVWRPLLAVTAWSLRTLAPLLDRGVPALERRGIFRRGVYL
jgi:Sulfotransferase family